MTLRLLLAMLASFTMTWFVGVASAAELENIAKSLKKNGVYRGSFHQTQYIVDFPKPIDTIGKFTIWTGETLMWKSQGEFPVKTIFESQDLNSWQSTHYNTYQYHYSPITNLTDRIIWSFFSADFSALSVDFEPVSLKPIPYWKIVLHPISHRARALVNKVTLTGSPYIETIEIQTASGDRCDLKISDLDFSSAALSHEERDRARP